ncbi:hypothetical protein [Clostridium intestinale]|jgi:hypothetical protein|uniref:DUF2383 domain-containing protein n=1 Tax=Clostridium intestinale DSM 6191 TaxID=1121320 RepID=A0A1M5U5G9_9CLOT|nr:hypothetical protein [Clostridium intestinale]WRY52974.1 hypothetical protein P8F83_07165 [Clostridium intestinale]SHH57943.1 hypothetical protein SAMN02745941_00407 [Clostridium intestinale DSM 6191]
MDGNIELLNYIYQNSEMGKDTLTQLIKMTTDENFKNNLQSQLNEYNSIFNEADEKLKSNNKESKSIGTLTKVSTYISINFNTLINKTPSHMAEMLIQGSTMGIIDITKKIKEYKSQDQTILGLANKLLQFEQKNIDELKKFL